MLSLCIVIIIIVITVMEVVVAVAAWLADKDEAEESRTQMCLARQLMKKAERAKLNAALEAVVQSDEPGSPNPASPEGKGEVPVTDQSLCCVLM